MKDDGGRWAFYGRRSRLITGLGASAKRRAGPGLPERGVSIS